MPLKVRVDDQWVEIGGGSSGNDGSSSNITLGTPQSSASGTEVEFTGIPSWVKRITLMFNLVSLDSNANYQIQLGASSAYITSGYTATSQSEDGVNDPNSCLLYTSPSPRDRTRSRMPSSA